MEICNSLMFAELFYCDSNATNILCVNVCLVDVLLKGMF